MNASSNLKTIAVAAIAIVSALMFVPFLWMVCTAFKPSGEAESPTFYPKMPQPENFLVILRMIPDQFSGKYLDLDLWVWIFNSIFVASWVTALQVTTSCLAASLAIFFF